MQKAIFEFHGWDHGVRKVIKREEYSIATWDDHQKAFDQALKDFPDQKDSIRRVCITEGTRNFPVHVHEEHRIIDKIVVTVK